MKENTFARVFWLALAFVLAGTGCTKQASAPPPVAPEKAAPAMENAFKDAPAEVKQQATEAVQALQKQDDAGAFVRLEFLSSRPELTAAQRQAAFDAWMVANQRMQEAASKGNASAKEMLEQYRARK